MGTVSPVNGDVYDMSHTASACIFIAKFQYNCCTFGSVYDGDLSMSLPWKFKINSKFPISQVYGKYVHTCDVPEIGWRIWILWCLSSTCLVVLHCTVSVHYSNGYFVPTCRAL